MILLFQLVETRMEGPSHLWHEKVQEKKKQKNGRFSYKIAHFIGKHSKRANLDTQK